MTATPVHLFVLDSAFTNRVAPAPPFYRSTGGVAQLSAQGLSYFQTPYEVRDGRPVTDRQVLWPAETLASFLVDNSLYGSFLTALTGAPSSVMAALFAIIDLLAFNYNPTQSTAALESLIAGDATMSAYYEPNTLLLGPPNANGIIYQNNNTTQNVVCPVKVNFTINIPSGAETLAFALTVWVQTAAFLVGYPNSTIIQVVPPTNYSDLLTMSLLATSATLTTLASGASFSQPLVNTALTLDEITGYATYTATLMDGTASLRVPFNIAYVGQIPTFAAMRTAILAAVQASGIGNDTLWKARIPELYVESRMYLIPIWDQRIASGSGTLYSGIASPSSQFTKAETVLQPVTASGLIQQYGECLLAAYNLISLVSVPDSTTQPSDSLATLYPTYQAVAPTDSNFSYMTTDAQSFATSLNTALAVAAGNTTNAAFPVINDSNISYVSFTQNSVEFCIITRAFYDQQLGVSA